MMSRIFFTPWKERSELFALRDQFYPPPSYDGPDMRERACSLVSVWKARGNLPHPVEATALITAAVLHDDARKHSVYSIQATYSTAFCRFVTTLVDRGVHGRKPSMYHLAAEIGIPASFVELRHEATHRDMPSLLTLQKAAQRSLEWLWQYYWAGIEDITPAITEMGSRAHENAVRKLVVPIVQRASISSTSVKEKRAFERDTGLSIAKELAMRCRQNEETCLITRLLLEEGIAVPGSQSDDKQKDAFISTWDPILQTLCHNHTLFLTSFVEEATAILVSSSETVKGENDTYREDIFTWLERILTSSGTWAELRKRYLVLSYVRVICREATGYWAECLRGLVGDAPGRARETPKDENEEEELRQTTPRKTPNFQNFSEEDDLAALRDYGWTANGTRACKPIGVI